MSMLITFYLRPDLTRTLSGLDGSNFPTLDTESEVALTASGNSAALTQALTDSKNGYDFLGLIYSYYIIYLIQNPCAIVDQPPSGFCPRWSRGSG